MSWRLLFFTLLVLAGTATLGGLYAGEWLVAHAPTQANLPNFDESDPPPLVSGNGIPVIRQAPQPLMDGKLGIPSLEVSVDWKVKAENLSQVVSASIAPTDALISSISQDGSSSQIIDTRPIQIAPPSVTTASTYHWEPTFRQEMAACRQLGFFDRAHCVGTVRDQYCGSNNAWGKVHDCPMR